MTYMWLEITRSCLQCARPLPVNGPLQHVRCAACSTDNPIAPVSITHALKVAVGKSRRLDAYQSETIRPLVPGGQYTLVLGPGTPTCRECGKVLPEHPVSVGDFPCPSCDVMVTNFAPPAWLASVEDRVAQLVLAERETAADGDSAQALAVDQAASRPVAMSCEACGGKLEMTVETPRVFPCPYCRAPTGIPEEVWERLHPVRATLRWYVRYTSDAIGDRSREQKMALLEKEQELNEHYQQAVGGGQSPGPSRFCRHLLSAQCPECESVVPFNGPFLRLPCPSCGHVVELAPHALGWLMKWLALDEARFNGRADLESVQCQWLAQRQPPSCYRCQTALELAEVGTDRELRCSGCGALHHTFPVPEPLREFAGAARQIYCTQREPDASPVKQPGTDLSVPCPSCGGDQVIDEQSPRIFACAYCGADLFVPDAVWEQLHPVDRARPWFVDAGQVPSVEERSGYKVYLGDQYVDLRQDGAGSSRRRKLIIALGMAALVVVAVLILILLVR